MTEPYSATKLTSHFEIKKGIWRWLSSEDSHFHTYCNANLISHQTGTYLPLDISVQNIKIHWSKHSKYKL
jgi:hypothetical protein